MTMFYAATSAHCVVITDRAIVLITNGNGLEQQQQRTLNVIRNGNKPFQNRVIIFAFTLGGRFHVNTLTLIRLKIVGL